MDVRETRADDSWEACEGGWQRRDCQTSAAPARFGLLKNVSRFFVLAAFTEPWAVGVPGLRRRRRAARARPTPAAVTRVKREEEVKIIRKEAHMSRTPGAPRTARCHLFLAHLNKLSISSFISSFDL
ncbi:hypothetical protein E2C01_050365 [Portunus trituberculatus]|uniref:Uncharacterized protein n=1 Tax=Portunus trituberculatus TaxID=210409 RepID=A0A5B7GIQ8_PORTR|nr:hypothetical protein [Portunus trituberculatus]